MTLGEITEVKETEDDKECTPSQFLSKIYGNQRLATPEAKEFHKTTLPEGIKVWADKNGLKEEDYIAIPIGSARTLPNNQSDIDIVIILNTEDEPKEEENNYARIFNFTRMKNHQERTLVHIVSAEKSSVFKRITGQYKDKIPRIFGEMNADYFVADLLITPDDMIYGNKELAQKLRLEAINYIENHNNIDQYWKNGIERYFRRNILNWYNCDDANKSEYRKERFDTLLEAVRERLNKQNDGLGDKWEKSLREYLKNIKFPSFNIFKTNLESDNGKLSITNSRFTD